MLRIVLALTVSLAAIAAAEDPPNTDQELDRWAKASKDHADAVATLRAYQELEGKTLEAPGGFEERRKQREELLKALKADGSSTRIKTLEELFKGLSGGAYRFVLAQALAGCDSKEAAAAVGRLLPKESETAVQMALVRYLPMSESSNAVLKGAFVHSEASPKLQATILRELARRAPKSGVYLELVRLALKTAKDAVLRAEAITLAGRLRKAELAEPLRALCDDQDGMIRQRAVVAYAEVVGEEALPFLLELATSAKEPLRLQASAVLAISRVGGRAAIEVLDKVAKDTEHEQIRMRAQRLVDALRRKEQ